MDDNDYEPYWAPVKYPGREAFTMVLCFGALAGFVIWMVSKLF
jgi:hypothetical protein